MEKLAAVNPKLTWLSEAAGYNPRMEAVQEVLQEADEQANLRNIEVVKALFAYVNPHDKFPYYGSDEIVIEIRKKHPNLCAKCQAKEAARIYKKAACRSKALLREMLRCELGFENFLIIAYSDEAKRARKYFEKALRYRSDVRCIQICRCFN